MPTPRPIHLRHLAAISSRQPSHLHLLSRRPFRLSQPFPGKIPEGQSAAHANRGASRRKRSRGRGICFGSRPHPGGETAFPAACETAVVPICVDLDYFTFQPSATTDPVVLFTGASGPSAERGCGLVFFVVNLALRHRRPTQSQISNCRIAAGSVCRRGGSQVAGSRAVAECPGRSALFPARACLYRADALWRRSAEQNPGSMGLGDAGRDHCHGSGGTGGAGRGKLLGAGRTCRFCRSDRRLVERRLPRAGLVRRPGRG